MKPFITGVAALLPSTSTRAETFLSSSNQVNSLVVASNEAIVISAARKTDSGYPDITGQISIAGKTNSLWLDSYNTQPIAIAGPVSLTFSNSVVLCFKRLPGNVVGSVYVFEGQTNTPVINVPNGQACRFFYPAGPNGSGLPPAAVTIASGGQSVSGIALFGAEEISGPAYVSPTFRGANTQGRAAIVSYYLTQDAAVVPELGLQGSSGSFEIVIEKSISLTNWLPVVIHSTSEEERAFYCLRISR